MIQSVIIVGHGESLHYKRYGHIIDRFSRIVRFAYFPEWRSDVDYGKRMDILMTSTRDHGDAINMWWENPDRQMPSELWLFFRPWERTDEEVKKKMSRLSMFNTVLCTEPDKWFARFPEYFGEELDKVDFERKPRMTRGGAAFITAVEKFKPEKVVLAGFDNVFLGTNSDFIDHYHKPPKEVSDMIHRYDAERWMIETCAKENNVEIQWGIADELDEMYEDSLLEREGVLR